MLQPTPWVKKPFISIISEVNMHTVTASLTEETGSDSSCVSYVQCCNSLSR